MGKRRKSANLTDTTDTEENMEDETPEMNTTPTEANTAPEVDPMAATEPVDVATDKPEDAPFNSTEATDSAMKTEDAKLSGDYKAVEETAPDTTGQGDGVQVSETSGIENPKPEEESKTSVEPEATGAPLLDTENKDGSFEKDIQALVADAGNAIYAAEKAFEDVGRIINDGTTAAFIKILEPRNPSAEAASRAAATDAGLANGTIKPEDAPGAQGADGKDAEGNDNGLGVSGPDHGNSRTEATEPVIDSSVNPVSPATVGSYGAVENAASEDVKETDAGKALSGSPLSKPDATTALPEDNYEAAKADEAKS